jgi:hypothetical protein
VSVPSSELAPPAPSSPLPRLEPKGGGGGVNTRLRVRGRGEPIPTTGEKAWHSVYSVVGNNVYKFAVVTYKDQKQIKLPRSNIRLILKVHKIENFFGFDFESCPISLLVMHK